MVVLCGYQVPMCVLEINYHWIAFSDLQALKKKEDLFYLYSLFYSEVGITTIILRGVHNFSGGINFK